MSVNTNGNVGTTAAETTPPDSPLIWFAVCLSCAVLSFLFAAISDWMLLDPTDGMSEIPYMLGAGFLTLALWFIGLHFWQVWASRLCTGSA